MGAKVLGVARNRPIVPRRRHALFRGDKAGRTQAAAGRKPAYNCRHVQSRAAANVPYTYQEYQYLPNDGRRYEIVEGELYVTPSAFPHAPDRCRGACSLR